MKIIRRRDKIAVGILSMPIFRLVDDVVFPPPDYADPSGLIAVGGDLSSDRLLEAYRVGIFPWYSEDQPILWWSPDPRFVLDLERFKLSHSLRKTMRRKIFQVTFDRVFDEVIAACAEAPREGQSGTWITPEMQEATSSFMAWAMLIRSSLGVTGCWSAVFMAYL